MPACWGKKTAQTSNTSSGPQSGTDDKTISGCVLFGVVFVLFGVGFFWRVFRLLSNLFYRSLSFCGWNDVNNLHYSTAKTKATSYKLADGCLQQSLECIMCFVGIIWFGLGKRLVCLTLIPIFLRKQPMYLTLIPSFRRKLPCVVLYNFTPLLFRLHVLFVQDIQ